MKIIACAIALSLLLSGYVMAQENPFAVQQKGNLRINVQITPEMERLNAPYTAAEEFFTPKQAEIMKWFESEYTKTAEPDVDIFSMGRKLELCSAKNMLSPDYNSKFIKFRDHKNKIQEKMWSSFYEDEIQKVDFLDHKIIKDHLVYTQLITLQVLAGMEKIAAKPQVDDKYCIDAKKEIDNYILKNGL